LELSQPKRKDPSAATTTTAISTFILRPLLESVALRLFNTINAFEN
jgi:hypothetical protein